MCILCDDYVDLFEYILGFFKEGRFNFVSKFLIDGMCVVALALATKTMSEVTFHPLVVMLLTSN